MSYTDDINKAAQALLEAEIRHRTIKAQVDGIEREISLLTNLEAQLQENIRWLKRRKIVTVASEYKKALESLEKAKNRRALLRIDRDNCLKTYKHTETVYEKAKQTHANLLEELHNPKSNVIEVDFRNKNGKR